MPDCLGPTTFCCFGLHRRQVERRTRRLDQDEEKTLSHSMVPAAGGPAAKELTLVQKALDRQVQLAHLA